MLGQGNKEYLSNDRVGFQQHTIFFWYFQKLWECFCKFRENLTCDPRNLYSNFNYSYFYFLLHKIVLIFLNPHNLELFRATYLMVAHIYHLWSSLWKATAIYKGRSPSSCQLKLSLSQYYLPLSFLSFQVMLFYLFKQLCLFKTLRSCLSKLAVPD